MDNDCICTDFVPDSKVLGAYKCKACGRPESDWRAMMEREQVVWQAGDPTLPQGATCELCGGWVDLSHVITVKLADPNGAFVEQAMTEAAVRRLLDELGIEQPPVLCDQHRGEPLPAYVEDFASGN